MKKNSKEALQFLDYMVEVSMSWEDSLSKDITKDKSSTKAPGEWHLKASQCN